MANKRRQGREVSFGCAEQQCSGRQRSLVAQAACLRAQRPTRQPQPALPAVDLCRRPTCWASEPLKVLLAVDGPSTTLPLPLPTARAPFRCPLIAACPTPPPTHATGLRTTASTARHRHGSLSAGPQAQPCLRVSLRREKGRGVTYRTADTCMGVIDARRGLLSR